MRQLPCQHVFHSTCICRWLVERHAVCPLCKIDLYEEEEEEEEEEESSEEEEPQPAAPENTWLGASWLSSFLSSPRQEEVEEEEQQQQTRTRWRFRWFSRPSRRRGESGGMSELAEPLLENDEEDPGETVEEDPGETLPEDEMPTEEQDGTAEEEAPNSTGTNAEEV